MYKLFFLLIVLFIYLFNTLFSLVCKYISKFRHESWLVCLNVWTTMNSQNDKRHFDDNENKLLMGGSLTQKMMSWEGNGEEISLPI
jgi:hypothetical protein